MFALARSQVSQRPDLKSRFLTPQPLALSSTVAVAVAVVMVSLHRRRPSVLPPSSFCLCLSQACFLRRPSLLLSVLVGLQGCWTWLMALAGGRLNYNFKCIDETYFQMSSSIIILIRRFLPFWSLGANKTSVEDSIEQLNVTVIGKQAVRLSWGRSPGNKQAWELYNERKLEELMDTSLKGDFNMDEASKYIKISFLCTQQMPKLRPSMSTVAKMLTGI